MKRIITAIALLSCLGCTVQKDLVPVSGSRADGTVDLAFEHGVFERPQLDRAQGDAAAISRCKSWGYQNAERFGGSTRRCVDTNYGTCVRWVVTATYQCTGPQQFGPNPGQIPMY